MCLSVCALVGSFVCLYMYVPPINLMGSFVCTSLPSEFSGFVCMYFPTLLNLAGSFVCMSFPEACCRRNHNMLELPGPGAKVITFSLCCNFIAVGSCPNLAQLSSFSNLPYLGVARHWCLGQAIHFYCNLSNLGLARPWRQDQAFQFVLQYTSQP